LISFKSPLSAKRQKNSRPFQVGMPSTAVDGSYLNFCRVGIQTAECPLCKNRNPCGACGFNFCKTAIGGLIAVLHASVNTYLQSLSPKSPQPQPKNHGPLISDKKES
jgi:hypothetical protein